MCIRDRYNIIPLSVDEILNDKNVDIILNLTIPQAHYEISKRALESNKHVYCEKPMSVKFDEAKELLNLAKKNSLYIGNAPETFLGGEGQLTRNLNDNNDFEQFLTGNFIFAFPGVQDFHPSPESWFQEGRGPVIDKRPYINFYGKYETLQEDFDYVCEKIGLPKTKLPHSNKSENDRDFKYERKLLEQ